MANSVDPDQTAPIGAVSSGSMLFASLLNLSVMLGNYLQQTTSADDIFRCIFSWRFQGLLFVCWCHLRITFCKQFGSSYSNDEPHAVIRIQTVRHSDGTCIYS